MGNPSSGICKKRTGGDNLNQREEAMTKKQSALLSAMTAAACIPIGYFLVDIPVTEYFHSLRERSFMEPLRLITSMGESQWYLVAGLCLWIVFRKRSDRPAYGGMLLFSSVALSGIAANLFKTLLGRARPHLYFKEGVYGFDFFHIDYSWLSFPSGHAATALGAASALALLFPGYRAAFYSAGLVIATSRIVLNEHYPSDVIAGSLLGYYTTVYLYHRFFREKMHG
ncbi:MAG: phosphatase PAP2 family protein [Chlorobium sp.]|nr:phosphatase PAP2 family protein [Chlorobium sp.]MCW8815792.1 phosphatase PAP2 family protein [Chlorobium sp.]MCW8819106.1 phosphatase PAP2 family protein [Ignavibacteriaceae bacterium]